MPGQADGEAAHDGGEEAGAGGLEGADAQRPDLARLQRRRSACAACRRATIESACRSSSSPASVSEIGRGPPGRSTSFSPTIRSSVAICWLTADWV